MMLSLLLLLVEHDGMGIEAWGAADVEVGE